MSWTCPSCAAVAELPEAAEGGGDRCPACLGEFGAEAAPVAGQSGPARFRPERARFTVRKVLTFGTVVGTAIPIWARNLVPFFLITTLVYSPYIIMVLLHANRPAEELTDDAVARFEQMTLWTGLILGYIANAAMVSGVMGDLTGRKEGIGSMVKTGFQRAIPSLWTAILAAVVTLSPLLPALLILIVGITTDNSPMLLLLGSLLTIVGFLGVLILSTMTYVSIAVSVVEKDNGWPAIRRSMQLSKANRNTILGLLLSIGLASFLLTLAFQAVTDTHSGGLYASLFSTLIVSSIGPVVMTSTYFHLRKGIEGMSVEQYSSVFE